MPSKAPAGAEGSKRALYLSEAGARALWGLLITLEMMVTTVEAKLVLMLATFTSCCTLLTTLDTCAHKVTADGRGGAVKTAGGRAAPSRRRAHLFPGQPVVGDGGEPHGNLGRVLWSRDETKR